MPSARPATQTQLASAELQSRELLESAPDAMIGVGREGSIQFANSQVEALFGYRREELIGQPVEVLVPDALKGGHVARRGTYFHAPRTRPMGAGLDLHARRRDGSEFPCEISLSSIALEGDTIAVAAVRDVTAAREAAEDLRALNADLEAASQAKDRFLASMSHELRTPLNAVLGFTGTLLMELPGPLNDEQRKQLETVRTSGKHLLSLINDLLDLAKIDSGKIKLELEPVEAQELIEDIAAGLRPLADEKQIALEVLPPTESLVVRSDRRALSQILINLANNAIKFTDAGTVRIGVERSDEDGVSIARFIVSDTGPGIAAEDQERLFAAFEQSADARPEEGTGLGLYISHRLAGLLDGRVRLQSALGEGSTFALELVEEGAG